MHLGCLAGASGPKSEGVPIPGSAPAHLSSVVAAAYTLTTIASSGNPLTRRASGALAASAQNCSSAANGNFVTVRFHSRSSLAAAKKLGALRNPLRTSSESDSCPSKAWVGTERSYS